MGSDVEIATREEWLSLGFVVKENQKPLYIKGVEHFSKRQVERKGGGANAYSV